MTIPFVDLKAQYKAINREIEGAIHRVFEESQFILGSDVKNFEDEYAQFCQTKYAFGISNGLDALRIALMALDVKAGDEVIMPANSFVATALAATGVGAKTVLVDCDRHTYMIDPKAAAAALTPKTKVIIPVHLMGLMGDMDAVNAVAAKDKIQVVEDAAQSHGATYKGKMSGSIGVIGCTSFYPTKNLGAYGDAGAITTNDTALAKKIDILHNYGQEKKYYHVVQGLNCRLDTIQAAILRVKLKHLAQWNDVRRNHAKAYIERLTGVGDLQFQHVPPDCTHVYHLFVIETARRDALQDYLGKNGVQTSIHYPLPIHLQPAYAELGLKKGAFPAAEAIADHMLSLPMYPELTMAQIDTICDQVRKFFKGS